MNDGDEWAIIKKSLYSLEISSQTRIYKVNIIIIIIIVQQTIQGLNSSIRRASIVETKKKTAWNSAAAINNRKGNCAALALINEIDDRAPSRNKRDPAIVQLYLEDPA